MARWKARVEYLLSVIELLFLSVTDEALQGKMCQNLLTLGGSGSDWAKISGEGVIPLPIYWYHLKGNWLHYNFAAHSFYIMKLCSRLLVLYCRNLYERQQILVFDPHFEEVRGGVEPWLMSRWKARVWLPIRHNWTFFVSFYRWGATRQSVSRFAAIRRG